MISLTRDCIAYSYMTCFQAVHLPTDDEGPLRAINVIRSAANINSQSRMCVHLYSPCILPANDWWAGNSYVRREKKENASVTKLIALVSCSAFSLLTSWRQKFGSEIKQQGVTYWTLHAVTASPWYKNHLHSDRRWSKTYIVIHRTLSSHCIHSRSLTSWWKKEVIW